MPPKYPSANNVASIVRTWDGAKFVTKDNDSLTE